MLPKPCYIFGNGGIYEQKIRCGKKGCRCTRGDMHVAHYLIYRDEGLQIKRYVRKADVAIIKQLVQRAQIERWAFRRMLRDSRESLRKTRKLLRDAAEIRRGRVR